MKCLMYRPGLYPIHITNEIPDALGYKGVSKTVNKSIYLNRHNYNAVKKKEQNSHCSSAGCPNCVQLYNWFKILIFNYIECSLQGRLRGVEVLSCQNTENFQFSCNFFAVTIFKRILWNIIFRDSVDL